MNRPRRAADTPPGPGPPAPRAAGGRDDALDGLRGAACLLVYVHHLGLVPALGPLAVPGYVGVHVFFVLSGYLVFGPFVAGLADGRRPAVPWRGYAARRFARVYPPYLVALAGYAAARHAGGEKPPGPASLAWHALMVFNYAGPDEFFRINMAFWTLAVEAQFYAALPLAVAAASRAWGPRRGRAAAWTVVAAFVATGLAARGLEFAATGGAGAGGRLTRFRTVFSFLDLFGAGMAAACAARLGAGPLRRSGAARRGLVGLGLSVFVAAASWSHRHAPGGWLSGPDLGYTLAAPACLCLGGALVVLGYATRPAGSPGWPLAWRPLAAVGAVSYGVYLYHVGVQLVAWRAAGRLGVLPPGYAPRSLLVGALALPPTLALSALSYALVERPAVRRARAAGGGAGPPARRAGPAPPGAAG